jgi:hypothetical protein
MLSPTEINRAIRRHRIALYASALILLGCLLGLNSLISHIGHRGTAGTLAVYLLGLALLLAAWFVALAYMSKSLLKHCPACGKGLGGQAAQIVIATKHCGLCGAKVIDGNPP